MPARRCCGYCHFGTGPEGAFDLSNLLSLGAAPPAAAQGQAPSQAPSQTRGSIVAPVVMRSRFLPHARFDHSKHAAVACEECHAARTAQTSAAVLIPGIENCLACHGAERADLRAESTCLTCHRFHQPNATPMRSPQAAAR